MTTREELCKRMEDSIVGFVVLVIVVIVVVAFLTALLATIYV